MGTGNRQPVLHLALHTVIDTKVDDTVNQNNGVIHGKPQLINDPHFGRCLSFDGVADYVEIKDPFVNNDNFTISLWVKPSQINDGQYHGFLGKEGDAKRKPSLWINPQDGGLHFDSYEASGAITDQLNRFTGVVYNFFLQAGEWVHLAWVKEADLYRFYRNGVWVDTQPAPVKFFTADSPYWIGKVDTFWDGEIAHLRMHTNVLTQEQIIQDMEMDLQGLLVHFPLDDLEDNGQGIKIVKDHSPNDHTAIATGNLRLVVDDDFGPVLDFDGSNGRIEVSTLVPETLPIFTVQTWIYADDLAGWRTIRNDQGWSPGKFHFQFNNQKLEFSIYGNSPYNHWFDITFQPKVWYNLAVCYNHYEKEVKLYVNGEFTERRTYTTAIPISPAPFWIGGWDGESRWQDGRIAGFRMYDRSLELPAIRRNMLDDQGAAAAYRQNHPFGFDLYENDTEAVIYIDDDPSDHTVALVVSNTSHKQLTIKPLGPGDASADLHHLEMRFRPGTLSAATLERIALVQDPDWQMSRPQPQGDGTIAIYLKGPDGRQLPIGYKKQLLFQNVTADPEAGTRGTRLDIQYKNFYYGQNEQQPVAGKKTLHLNIVNHRGKKNIPLHPGLMGPNTILNDGQSDSKIQIRITNILDEEAIPLNTTANSAAEEVSKFIISFDVGAADKEWALGTRSQVEGVTVEVNFEDEPNGWSKIDESSHGQGISPQWVIASSLVSLAAGRHIQIRLSGIKTGHPSGHTNVYIRYENIPGYWNGQFVLPIEKSHLIYKDIFDNNNNFTGESRIGIGVANPRTELDLGKAVVSGALNDYTKAQFTMSGGGQVSWEGLDGRLKWTSRFIVIAMGRPNSFAYGHLNLDMPTSDIPAAQVYNGVARSANANGIVLSAWEALYGVHPVGGIHTDVSYRVVRYDYNFNAPTNWILLAVVNGDDGSIKLGTGQILTSRSASSGGGQFFRGMIMLWSGTVANIPYGWALCNGQNGTPNLADRFVVGAGSAYNPGDQDGQNSVTLNINQIPAHNHSGSTSAGGEHYHWIEGTDANGLAHRQRTIWGQTTVDMGFGGGWNADPNDARWRGHVNTGTDGNHGHSFTTSIAGGNQAHENRPPYYALAYIMKL